MEENYLKNISASLQRIADALEVLARPGKDYSPNYVRPIEEYSGFDWESINATVVKSDGDGPTHIQWNGKIYTRRSPSNKFDPAVWYSTASGKSEDGETEYVRLITFREIKGADPLPEKAREIAGKKPQPATNGNGAHVPAPAPAAPAHRSVSFREYIANAKAKSIAEEGARWIAQQAEVNPEDDHAVIDSYLPFFYEAKHAGMKLSEAWKLLEENGKDPKKAVTHLPNL